MLPAGFLERMAALLGEEEYGRFAHTFTQSPHAGLRVNTLKIAPEALARRVPFALQPIGAPAPSGFFVDDDSRPGSHPYHAAGLYYLQEPSAMMVGRPVQPQPGELVLDLAAAPGGKATHLAALMQDDGLLVANDINTGRARVLAENMERWGARNVLITNATPDRLAERFGPIFDRVLVDAPCSGEGMFRRSGPFAWSEANVLACARRQTAVLDSAAHLVRPGGTLVYATCTFAPEENEQVVADFTASHSEFSLVTPPPIAGAAPGRPSWLRPEQAAQLDADVLARTVRLWPHQFPGEGHFIAVLRRSEGDHFYAPPPLAFDPPRDRELTHWHAFVQETLRVDFPTERMVLARNGRLYLLPARTLETSGVRLVRYGLLLGEVRRGYFRPAHTLALALKAEEATAVVDWPADSEAIADYLTGLDLPVAGPNGWVLVTVDGFPLGWGKRVHGRLKNHYPRGLRRPG